MMHALKRMALVTTLAALGLGAAPAIAQNKAPVEGTDFNVISTPQPNESAGKVEVIEFFGYWCPHCNEFDPVLNQWIKAQRQDVVVKHVPVAFNASQMPLQRLYYVLDSLNEEGRLRSEVFAAIHKEHNPLNTPELQADWAAKHGIDRKKYLDLYNSFAIQTKVSRIDSMLRAYGVDGVPYVTVDGKYSVSNTPTVTTTLDYLVSQERMRLKGAPAPAGK